jgi:L-fuculose-phosphate aldolase
MTELALRKQIIAMCLQMNATGLNQGTSGNISARCGDHMLITPSGIPYAQIKPKDIAKMVIDSDDYKWEGPFKPSSEWHFHRAIMQHKPDIGGIIHTHSTFATILSIGREDIPACHYMIAAFGGNTVKCAGYATFGTAELSNNVIKAMKDRTACLLANHGMIAGGADLDSAMWAAVELETLSKQYYFAKQSGNVVILPKKEMDVVLGKFKDYGQKPKAPLAKKKASAKKQVTAKKKRVAKKKKA